ncbi:hypothetical protein PORCRE_64 [Porphyromonas crevioricanis JCM 15906]|uniref:Uncharacterized protein n=1 Tax=Porphyromonas crevioricanis JCM 15906 TaxID=1305617 RepID=S4NAZ2_9PORP|nr:hypothetical protein PORCRE_64 [Porphyromonas crevioricanis JCM 15906]GAD07803.1 hypothetical protein PORCAN_1431 [Porphyromonas crevioricanis JCM 13913]
MASFRQAVSSYQRVGLNPLFAITNEIVRIKNRPASCY